MEDTYYRFKLQITGAWCIINRVGDVWYLFGSKIVKGPIESEDLEIYGTIGECIKFPKK